MEKKYSESVEKKSVDPRGTSDYRLPSPRSILASEIEAATVYTDPQTGRSNIHARGRRYRKNPRNPPPDKGRWVAYPSLGQGQFSQSIWHYSDASGVIGILGGHSLWASSIQNLNDSREFYYGLDIFREIIEKSQESRYLHPQQKLHLDLFLSRLSSLDNSELYVCCSSLAEDDLAQWRLYGGGDPHAVVLDGATKLSVLGRSDAPATLMGVRPYWEEVVYGVAEQVEYLERVAGYVANFAPPEGVMDLDSDHALIELDLVRRSLLLCKDPSYAHEKEVRCIVREIPEDKIYYRHGKYGVTPYLKLTGGSGDARTSRHPRPLPITKVVVGPTSHKNSSYSGLARMAKDYEREIDVDMTLKSFHR